MFRCCSNSDLLWFIRLQGEPAQVTSPVLRIRRQYRQSSRRCLRSRLPAEQADLNITFSRKQCRSIYEVLTDKIITMMDSLLFSAWISAFSQCPFLDFFSSFLSLTVALKNSPAKLTLSPSFFSPFESHRDSRDAEMFAAGGSRERQPDFSVAQIKQRSEQGNNWKDLPRKISVKLFSSRFELVAAKFPIWQSRWLEKSI